MADDGTRSVPATVSQAANSEPAIIVPLIIESKPAVEIQRARTPLLAAAAPEEPTRYPEWPQIGAPGPDAPVAPRPDIPAARGPRRLRLPRRKQSSF